MTWPDVETMTRRESNWIDYLLPVIVCLPLVGRIVLLPATRVGNDTQTHIYKTQILVEQVLAGVPPGLYDWSWYAGNEFLQVYPPLFYLLSAAGSLVGLSAGAAAIAVVVGSFVLGAIYVYRTILYLTESRGPALLGATAFVYFPTHIASYFLAGGLPRVLAIGIAPVAVYYLIRYQETREYRDFVLWAFAGAAVIYSNHGVGFIVILAICLWVLYMRQPGLAVVYGLTTTILSLPVLVPYATYDIANDLPVVAPDLDLLTAMVAAILHPAAGGLVITVLLAALTAILFVSGDRTPEFTVSIAVIGTILGYNIVAYVVRIPILQLAAFMRSTPALVIFMSIALGLGAYEVDVNTRKLLLAACCGLIVVEAMFVPHWIPQQDAKYEKAFDEIQADSDELSRWVFLPRTPVGAFATDEAGVPTIDGWYVQAMQKDLYDELGSTMHPKFIKLEDDITASDVNESIDRLEYLGVEYIVVEKAEPTLGLHRSTRIHEVLAGHPRLELLSRYQSVSVYRIRNFSQLEVYPYNPETESEYLTGDNASLTVHRFDYGGKRTEIIIETAEERWVVVPVADTTSMSYSLDQESIEPAPAHAGMVKVHVEPGVHRFAATPQLPPRTALSVLLSVFFATLLIALRHDATRHKVAEGLQIDFESG